MSKRSRSSLTEKKKRSRSKEDILPVELIHPIQSLLPLKEAARTRILSKSWLHAWYTIPTLRIIPSKPNKLISTVEDARKYNKLIRTTLQRYHRDNMPIESFHLRLNIRKNCLKLADVKNWIRLAVSKSYLKDLSLNIMFFVKKSLALPNELFSSQNLHTINVTAKNDDFNTPLRICTNPSVINCVYLRVLDLKYVVISEDVLHNLLSVCSLLEKIKLLYCKGLKNVKVKNLLRLTKLDILSVKEKDDRPVVNVQVYAPRLLSFIYTGKIPGLLFQTTAPEQVKLNFIHREDFGHTYFLNMNEALNSSSKFDINIESANLDSVVHLKYIDVDDLRRRVLFPVGNVQLTLETGDKEDDGREYD
ncbi:F-box protein-like protein [Tanacetum coccineum]